MITPESVLAARPDAQPTHEFYCELVHAGAIVAEANPMERREVAAFLRAILGRSPVADSRHYEPHRAILGAVLRDLETYALLDADEVVEPSDIRDSATLLREREAVQSFRDWVAHERDSRAASYHAYVDSILDHP